MCPFRGCSHQNSFFFSYSYSTAIRTHPTSLCHTYRAGLHSDGTARMTDAARILLPAMHGEMHGENYDPVFLSLQFCECVLVRVRTTDSLPRTFTKLSLFCPYGLVCQAFSGTWEEPGRKYGAAVKKQSLVKTDREIKVLCLCLQRSSLLDIIRFILNTRMSLIYGLQ